MKNYASQFGHLLCLIFMNQLQIKKYNTFHINSTKQTSMIHKLNQKRQQYVKVPMKSKVMVLNEIIFGNIPIKQSAKRFNIKYSTAKTFLRQYRRNQLGFQKSLIQNFRGVQIFCNNIKNQTNSELKRCDYKMIVESKVEFRQPNSDDQCQKNNILSLNDVSTDSNDLNFSDAPVKAKRVQIVTRISFD